MKTIVVPTDFSTSAEHAASYAAELAKIINASVLLLHVYQLPVAMSDFPVLMISAEELKNNADAGLQKLKDTMQQKYPAVQFEVESRMGDVVEEIESACTKRDVVTLVTGTKNLSGFERFLLGNTAISIVKNCSWPVITVPEGVAIKPAERIALAVDDDDSIPADKIKSFVHLFGAELSIVHVETGENTSPIHVPDDLGNTAYHSIKEDDVSEGIQHFVKDNKIDMVLILPHKHNLLERIFFKGHTSELVNEMPVPVLCIK